MNPDCRCGWCIEGDRHGCVNCDRPPIPAKPPGVLATVLGVIDQRIRECHRIGTTTDDADLGWDCGIEASSLRELRKAVVAAVHFPSPQEPCHQRDPSGPWPSSTCATCGQPCDPQPERTTP